jgi:hypothetical protein
MSTKDSHKRKPAEPEIDQIVAAQANDDSAWEKPVRVRRTEPASLSIPADLAARATFLAQLHHTKNVDHWLTHIIQERIEMEEAAFIGVKQDLAAKSG